MIHTGCYDSPVGYLHLTEKDGFLKCLKISDTPCPHQTNPVIDRVCLWLSVYFSGTNPSVTEIPMDPDGTVFQKEVWDHLRMIPYGQTVTYGQIAKKIAAARGIPKMSPQAVGQAVGANPISIMIPCHRVMGAGGNLTGYEWGIQKKLWLLTLEQRNRIEQIPTNLDI